MDIRRITFGGNFPKPHLSIDCWPPFVDLNPLYRAASMHFVQPYKLAIDAGKLSEESAVRVLAQAYAEGVIAKSPTDGFQDLKGSDWIDWLVEHPDHFADLRAHVEVRRLWDDPHGEAADGHGSVQP